MPDELLITLQADRLTLRCPQNGRHHTAFNTVCLNGQNRVVAIGKSREQVEKSDPEVWARIAAEARFVPILGDLSDIHTTLTCLLYFFVRMNIRQLKFNPPPEVILRLRYPGYEALPAGRRSQFEFEAGSRLSLAELWINDQKVSYPRRNIALSGYLRFLMTFPWLLVGLFALPLIGAGISPSEPVVARAVNLGLAILLILGTILASMGSQLLWFWLMRRFVPVFVLRDAQTRPIGFILFPKRFQMLIDRVLAGD